MRKTKIICTMGPAVDSEEVIKKLILNGMDCARLNFSHGDQKEHKVRMDRIKKVRKELKMPTPILLDTRGPEIRLKNFENESIIVETGQKFTFYPDDGTLGNQERVCISYPELANDLQIGSEILVDDGKVGFDVI
ncbi:MAG: pyruvate kinase, partial [Bacilli bacterium]|nr:pyruvate kinase [Bacilli bacterium]